MSTYSIVILNARLSVEQIKEVLKSDGQIQSLAKELYQQKSILVMGRGYNYATCLEGALVTHTHFHLNCA